MTETTSFLHSKHTEEIHNNLRRFSEIEAVQSIYSRQVSKDYYSVYVFLGETRYSDKTMNKLLDKEGEILDLYPDDLFQFSYLQDTNVFVAGEDAIVIFSRKYT